LEAAVLAQQAEQKGQTDQTLFLDLYLHLVVVQAAELRQEQHLTVILVGLAGEVRIQELLLGLVVKEPLDKAIKVVMQPLPEHRVAAVARAHRDWMGSHQQYAVTAVLGLPLTFLELELPMQVAGAVARSLRILLV
jgi:hypothetical protein